MFKDPFPPHENGESSNTKNAHAKVNYTYIVNDNIIHMVEPIDDQYCNVITIKGKEDAPKCKNPFVLKGPLSDTFDMTPSDACANTVIRSRARIELKGLEPSATMSNPTTNKTTVSSTGKTSKLVPLTNTASYSILDQLQRTLA